MKILKRAWSRSNIGSSSLLNEPPDRIIHFYNIAVEESYSEEQYIKDLLGMVASFGDIQGVSFILPHI